MLTLWMMMNKEQRLLLNILFHFLGNDDKLGKMELQHGSQLHKHQ